MSFLKRLLNPAPPPLTPLWGWITETARDPYYYTRHQVADTVDGRFDMVALVNNDAMNQALYGRALGIRDILTKGAVASPPEAEPFIATLNSYAAIGR